MIEEDDFYGEAAHKLAAEVGRTATSRKKLTARQLLKRFGFAKRGAQNVQTVTHSLHAAGLSCDPPLGDVDGLDAAVFITLESAPTTKAAAPVKNRSTKGRSPVIVASDEDPLPTSDDAVEYYLSHRDKLSKHERVALWKTFTPQQRQQATHAMEQSVHSASVGKGAAPIPVAHLSVADLPVAHLPVVPPSTRRTMSLQEVMRLALQATVQIRLEDGHGSGFVIDRSGIVLTARHVVDRNEKVEVCFSDGKTVEGEVLLADTTLDYAFVQVPPCAIAFSLRSGIEPQVGQSVYAVGSPLDRSLAGSVTRGIISAVERVRGGVTYLQTDAAIHGGNSGGPLIDESGMIVGMNVAGRREGDINWALPTSYLMTAWEALRSYLPEREKRQYCIECGHSNSPDSWLECATWVCCGNCGIVLGELHRDEKGAD